MIRLIDAFVLAHTKLKTHKIRTGIAVAISGLLFGLIGAVIIVAQGIFTSVDNFSDVGLNSRTILSINHYNSGPVYDSYDKKADPSFVAEVEAEYKAFIAKKTAAAKKYGIEYNASNDDPSPITTDPKTKTKVVKESALGDAIVMSVVARHRTAEYKPFDVAAYVQAYPSAHVIQKYQPIVPAKGTLDYMKDGKENLKQTDEVKNYTSQNDQPPSLLTLDGSISKPFVSNSQFDPSKGEIPVVIPFKAAEKALGLKTVAAGAPASEKLARLKEVRERIGQVSAHFCYRNEASKALLSRAISQQQEIQNNTTNKDYVKPALLYKVPDATSCGAVTVASDTRSAEQKKTDAKQESFEKEIGVITADPVQHLVTVRGVGISSEPEMSGQWSVTDLTNSLFTSWLGVGVWTIPADLLAKVPEAQRPAEIFESEVDIANSQTLFTESYLVEFGDQNQARMLLKSSGTSGDMQPSDTVFVVPFGSAVLVVADLRDLFTKVLLWALLIVGSIAVVVLAGIIGRTVSEGRRESSVFRAIGANRLDITAIYGMYVLLLCIRVIIFAAVLAIAAALCIELLFWHDATLGARLAYASVDVTKEFHLFSLTSPYLIAIIGSIVAAGGIASIIPILLGARRNPIKDMRNE